MIIEKRKMEREREREREREYFLQLKAKSLAKLLQRQSQRKYNYHHHQGENLWPQYFTSYPLKKKNYGLFLLNELQFGMIMDFYLFVF